MWATSILGDQTSPFSYRLITVVLFFWLAVVMYLIKLRNSGTQQQSKMTSLVQWWVQFLISLQLNNILNYLKYCKRDLTRTTDWPVPSRTSGFVCRREEIRCWASTGRASSPSGQTMSSTRRQRVTEDMRLHSFGGECFYWIHLKMLVLLWPLIPHL